MDILDLLGAAKGIKDYENTGEDSLRKPYIDSTFWTRLLRPHIANQIDTANSEYNNAQRRETLANSMAGSRVDKLLALDPKYNPFYRVSEELDPMQGLDITKPDFGTTDASRQRDAWIASERSPSLAPSNLSREIIANAGITSGLLPQIENQRLGNVLKEGIATTANLDFENTQRADKQKLSAETLQSNLEQVLAQRKQFPEDVRLKAEEQRLKDLLLKSQIPLAQLGVDTLDAQKANRVYQLEHEKRAFTQKEMPNGTVIDYLKKTISLNPGASPEQQMAWHMQYDRKMPGVNGEMITIPVYEIPLERVAVTKQEAPPQRKPIIQPEFAQDVARATEETKQESVANALSRVRALEAKERAILNPPSASSLTGGYPAFGGGMNPRSNRAALAANDELTKIRTDLESARIAARKALGMRGY